MPLQIACIKPTAFNIPTMKMKLPMRPERSTVTFCCAAAVGWGGSLRSLSKPQKFRTWRLRQSLHQYTGGNDHQHSVLLNEDWRETHGERKCKQGRLADGAAHNHRRVRIALSREVQDRFHGLPPVEGDGDCAGARQSCGFQQTPAAGILEHHVVALPLGLPEVIHIDAGRFPVRRTAR